MTKDAKGQQRLGGNDSHSHSGGGQGGQGGRARARTGVTSTKVKKSKCPSAYNLYVKDQAALVKQKMPQISFADMSRYIAKTWKELDESARLQYKVNATNFKLTS